MATVWAEGAAESADVFLRLDDGAAIDVSSSTPKSMRPQVALDDAGRAHVVWVEPGVESKSTDIWYTSCAETGCPEDVASGAAPDVFFDSEGGLHLAWCGNDGAVGYQPPDGANEQIVFPACLNGPRLAQDSEGLLHLVWYSDQVRNHNGIKKAASLLDESIRTDAGWSEPAITALTQTTVQPAVATQPGGSLYLAGLDGTGEEAGVQLVRQSPFACSDDELVGVKSALIEAITTGNFYTEGFQTPHCGNAYVGMIFTPNPEPAFSLSGDVRLLLGAGQDARRTAVGSRRIGGGRRTRSTLNDLTTIGAVG